MVKQFITLMLVAASFSLFAAEAEKITNLKGFVIENINGEKQPLVMAYVYCDNTTYTAYTNNNGQFVLDIPEGKHDIKVSFMGYESVTININTKKTKELSIELKKDNSLASKF